MPDLDPVETLLAEAEIRRVVLRYCRAVDRMDEALLRTCYHSDATDDHGTFAGTVDEYVTWVWRILARYQSTMHLVANLLVDFDGPRSARAESYGVAVHRSADPDPKRNLTIGFRYVDRFEQRGGEWRIAHRVAVTDWVVPVTQWWPVAGGIRLGARDQSDAAYWV